MDILGSLENYSLSYEARCQIYQKVEGLIGKQSNITEDEVRRLLLVCNHDLEENTNYEWHIIDVMTFILKKIKTGQCATIKEVPTALVTLEIIRIAHTIKAAKLQTVCFDTFNLYHDEVFVKLSLGHKAEFMEMFMLYFNQTTSITSRSLPFSILLKTLKALPLDKRREFVEENLKIWFSKVIPAVMNIVVTNNPIANKAMDALEILTDELVHIDYSKLQDWQNILDCIYMPQKFPSVMKVLLENQNDNWQRLWIIYVRLLKDQITMNKNKHGSTINSLLPIVEKAFKMDHSNRCKAFKCWNVLIDNFASETNKGVAEKRLKLLIIPLKSNNTKVEVTALAKFDTWWHLIWKFSPHIDNLFSSVVLPFLNFCFGCEKNENIAVPGLVFPAVTEKAVEALVEMTGHTNCTGCVTAGFPRLNKQILNTKLLTEFTGEWLYVIKTYVKTVCSDQCSFKKRKQHLLCIWSSFLGVAADTPAHKRKEIGQELVQLIKELVQECKDNDNSLKVLSTVLIMQFFETKVRPMLGNDDSAGVQVKSLLKFVLLPTLQKYYCSSEKGSSKLRLITNCLFDKDVCDPNDIIEWILRRINSDDHTLVFWSAVIEAAAQIEGIRIENLKKLLMWPLGYLHRFYLDVQPPAMVWNTSYDKLKTKLVDTSITQDITAILNSTKTVKTNHFLMYALMQTLKNKLEVMNSAEYEAEKFSEVLLKFESYVQIEVMMPVIVDVLCLMLNKAIEGNLVTFAEFTVTAVSSTLAMLNLSLVCGDNDQNIKYIEKLLKLMNEIFKNDNYVKFKSLIVEEIIGSATKCNQNDSVKESVCAILKHLLKKTKTNEEPLYTMIKNALKDLEKVQDKTVETKKTLPNKFTTPETKVVAKKSKQKEAAIVNTVTKDGEEYVVVKSNWKFNPRKLTENQKEKLQRKRDDIPALYQDLSQFQEEFRLTAWKTDSQDTSTSNSKSESRTGNENNAAALKNMASTDVVPKIMENIFSDANKNEAENATVEKTSKTPVVKLKVVTPKGKSPRVALKDRVCQNVKNLIEKSSLPNSANKEANQSMADTVTTTPKSQKNVMTATYSAPSKLNADRPSRVKRKPRKYELDFTDVPTKKRRNSTSSNSVDNQADPDDFDTYIDLKVKNAIDSNSELRPVEITTDTVVPEIVDSDVTIKPTEPAKEIVDLNKVNEDVTIPETQSPAKNSDEQTPSDVIVITSESPVAKTVETPASKVVEDKVEVSNKKAKKPRIMKELAIDTVEGNPFLKNGLEQEDKTVSKEVLKESPVVDDTSKPTDDSSAKTIATPITKVPDTDKTKSSSKKPAKSRIVKELAIDMVEGHPFLEGTKENSQTSSKISTRRKNLPEKLNRSNAKKEKDGKQKKTPSKSVEKNDKTKKDETSVSKEIPETISGESSASDDVPMSEDFIESSQDSTLTTISVKSNKSKQAVVVLNKMNDLVKSKKVHKLGEETLDNTSVSTINETDIEFSRNKSVEEPTFIYDLTADMDTEPIDKEIQDSSEVICVNDKSDTPIDISTEKIGHSDETLQMATADTEPMDPDRFNEQPNTANIDTAVVEENTQITDVANDSGCISSPFKDQEQRNKDFLNDTLEISPIKTMSPVQDESSNSSETTNDYIVIKLTSPVQSNGEPYEERSPEVFTEDKVSPDKRNQSPPREKEVANLNTSPSSSLSLKKRPQVRQGGRGAQMLGLCVPDRLQTMLTSEKAPEEEVKKSTPQPARRNFRILLNCTENQESNSDESEDVSGNFLKFKRAVPSADSSPSVPILKRKFIDLTDDANASPASKRKRVSFHDPPVSTTVSVHKYIEPLGVRSPQGSHLKKQRPSTNMKSPKKLENVFKLDNALTKTIESFVEINTMEDTEMSSLDPTLSLQVIRNDELNNTDPICLALVNCKDPISNIASELSSPAMKSLLLKEFEGQIETIGDLAKMTELQVNRLCIKAPKIKVAKSVLDDYAAKVLADSQDMGPIEQVVAAQVHVAGTMDVHAQTDVVSCYEIDVQTMEVELATVGSQANVCTSSMHAQTDESGAKSTKDIVDCLVERSDYTEELSKSLSREVKKNIANDLSFTEITELLHEKISSDADRHHVLDTTVQSLPELGDYLCDKYTSKDIILFCSELLRRIHDKTTLT